MKQLVLTAVFMLCSLCTYAEKDVTQFLGIPVDGTKSEMIRKLKAKGFKPLQYDKEILEGEFNGADVQIHVVTNNNKVWRIMVAETTLRDKDQIRIRYNTLCQQFDANDNYRTDTHYKIYDFEDIAHELSINSTKYQAAYYQRAVDENIFNWEICRQKLVWFTIREFEGDFYISMFYDNEYNCANGEDL